MVDLMPDSGRIGTSPAGRVALVTGATRGAGRGIAVQLGAVGATVYVTGRTTGTQRSQMNRPETIEETAALVDEAGGHGIPVRVDHLVPSEVSTLVARIRRDHGCLHVLVNDIWGAEIEWGTSVGEFSPDTGLHTLRLAVDTQAITSHYALPFLIEQPGGWSSGSPADRRVQRRHLSGLLRPMWRAIAEPARRPHPHAQQPSRPHRRAAGATCRTARVRLSCQACGSGTFGRSASLPGARVVRPRSRESTESPRRHRCRPCTRGSSVTS